MKAGSDGQLNVKVEMKEKIISVLVVGAQSWKRLFGYSFSWRLFAEWL
jgi:hypothetical protein